MCGMQIGGNGKQECAGEKCFPWTGEEQLFIFLEASGSEVLVIVQLHSAAQK